MYTENISTQVYTSIQEYKYKQEYKYIQYIQHKYILVYTILYIECIQLYRVYTSMQLYTVYTSKYNYIQYMYTTP